MGDSIVVGYGSALDFWRGVRVAAPHTTSAEPVGRVFGARRGGLSALARVALGCCNARPPLDVVVDSPAGRHHCPTILDHVWKGPVPAEARYGLGSGVEVCRPAVVFAQLATELDLLCLARVGYEMTGCYAMVPWSDEGCVDGVRPLAALGELKEYARAARALGVRGAARAEEALSLVVPNAKSPREADLAAMMALSRSKGGFGLRGFVLN